VTARRSAVGRDECSGRRWQPASSLSGGSNWSRPVTAASCRRYCRSSFRWKPGAIGVSLGFSTAVSIFGGLAPLVATWLIAATGDSLSPSYYLIFTALLSLIALMAIQWLSRRVIQAQALVHAA
jgi:hypothetical protein